MYKKIVIVGATGKLAPLVMEELVGQGFELRALVRNPETGIEKIPKEIKIVKGDLADTKSLLYAFQGMDAVYLNLSTKTPDAPFQPEYDGGKNVVWAAKQTGIKRLFQISSTSAIHPEFAKGKEFYMTSIRTKGHRLIRESGIPYSFFHCSWFMESLELLMHKGDKIQGFKPANYPFYWIAGKDYAKMVANAMKLETDENRDYIMQGNEAVTMEDAVRRYANTFSPSLDTQIAPVWLLKCIGLFNKEVRLFAKFADYFKNYEERLVAQATWNELGHPQRIIETFSQS